MLDNNSFFRGLWFSSTFLSCLAVSPMADNWSKSEKTSNIGLSSVLEFNSPPSPPEKKAPAMLAEVFLFQTRDLEQYNP
jgi:hypothetical protein